MIAMNHHLHTINGNPFTLESQDNYATHLESGKIIYLPDQPFQLNQEEQVLLSDTILSPKHKNISYNSLNQRLAGLASDELTPVTKELMQRFSDFTKTLINQLFPRYSDHIQWGRTSFRPAEIKGRITSKQKDDTRLHVDSFSATPVHGLRILRVFSNVNPSGDARVWHVGEPFSDVLSRFSAQISRFQPLKAHLLRYLHATKTLRTPYDHYMLNLHNAMKLDDDYQARVDKQRIEFPAQSTWIVFTDHVSHAALSGQFLLEQTIYLPVTAMHNEALSPLRMWEQEKKQVLI
jgi:hypothetical protein